MSTVLPFLYQNGESGYIEQVPALRGSESRMQTVWYHQLEMIVVHFISLVPANRGFKCQQMFVLNSPGFSQNLPPAVLQRGLDAKHCQQCRIIRHVTVFPRTREQKIRPGLSFRLGPALIAD